jgi:hypothetical protein
MLAANAGSASTRAIHAAVFGQRTGSIVQPASNALRKKAA